MPYPPPHATPPHPTTNNTPDLPPLASSPPPPIHTYTHTTQHLPPPPRRPSSHTQTQLVCVRPLPTPPHPPSWIVSRPRALSGDSVCPAAITLPVGRPPPPLTPTYLVCIQPQSFEWRPCRPRHFSAASRPRLLPLCTACRYSRPQHRLHRLLAQRVGLKPQGL